MSSLIAKTPEYRSWNAMIQRCTNPNNDRYARWGGRGITVCRAWLKFENFLCDMGERPDGTMLERIDNDGNYELGNCRWATRKEQGNNRGSFNCYIEAFGKRQTLCQWRDETGIHDQTIKQRIARGWPANLAVSVVPYGRRRQ